MNHLMTRMGALINASANSTITVTQIQHGHIQLNTILHPKHFTNHSFYVCMYMCVRLWVHFTITSTKHDITSITIFINLYQKRERLLKRKKAETNPTIQMKTPTIERRRERKAKGSPKRNPKGLHWQLSSQHIASFSVFVLTFLLITICD